MDISLEYGSDKLAFSFPENQQVEIIEPSDTSQKADEQHVINMALDHPIESLQLEKIVRRGERTVIVIPDRTRSCRSAIFLPMLIERLNLCGISDRDITILIANGSHSLCSTDDMLYLVGDALYRRIHVQNHDCHDESALVHMGETTRGTQVYLNKALVRAERVILTGGILHHYFAGFGGGPKLVTPGCAGYNTIMQNHSHTIHPEFHSLHPQCFDGNVLDNPVQEDLRETLKFIRVDFTLHIVMDFDGNIYAATAGELLAAHQRACDQVDRLYRMPVKKPADLVIVSCGGFPKDLNIIQAHKSIHHAFYTLKEKGVMIVLARCEDGIGSKTFLEWFENETLEKMHHALRENFKINGNTALALMQKATQAKIILISELDPEIVTRMGLIPASTLEEAYEQARESLPETFDTLVIPYGALTLPYIDETTPEFIARQGSLILQRTIEYVKRSQQFNTSGHDWWHTWRVWQMAKRLAREEGADMFVVELAALLHDLADWKYTDANEHAASDWLASQQVPRAIIRHVDEIVGTLSFKGAGVDSKMSSLEGKVVQDADRLDAMGAIGIARTFAYGGSKNRLLHSPEIKPVIHQTPEEYKQRVGTTINHFYEKLLLLKERMNTEPARKIAAARHHFLGSFLARFFDEWEGKA